jgi:uncharacterized protein YjbJ (UPF0337 family)
MAIERIEGSVRNVAGKAEEGFGKAIGDTATEVRGRVNQAAGAVQEAYGRTRDAAAEGGRAVKDAVVGGHDVVAKFMEKNPHATAIIALGIGLLIGYAAHRPPPRRHWWD